MKRIAILSMLLILSIGIKAQDITVEEIIDRYLEKTGGKENWRALKGIRLVGTVPQGELDIPLEIVQLSDGRQYTKFTFQGMDFYQNVYNGEYLWSINFETLEAELVDQESFYNFRLDLNDFPDSFLDYQEKGYKAELIGLEDFMDKETYKVKLQKENRLLDGQEFEDVSYYYFDTKFSVSLGQETPIKTGEQSGQINRTTQGDFKYVDGFIFPYELKQGIKGQELSPVYIKEIEINPEIDDDVFTFPGN